MTPDEARAALAGKGRRGPVPTFSPEEAKRRASMRVKAQSHARETLVRLHKDEYDVLYRVALDDLLAQDTP